ncbi:hypothetical protein M5K25_026947 [Dendrobium thyrsiflorum]|uniref:Glycosyl transferase 48 domain-containing protein n=1 Tax=Dendrobium thyrsiflorum TaxID=117978 RepID=A0ABD0TYJ9_DENTH
MIQIIEEKKSESLISDTQASFKDKLIDKEKNVKEEGKEINLQGQVDGADQEIYRIKLPRATKIGEGEMENQNHAIVFIRGEALQAIDMNQDNYLEEALKMRNLLEEFNEDYGLCSPTILGVRDHIFTGSISSLGCFMSNQETSFETIGQRVLATPLKVCFQYGHPDVFDRNFHIIRGVISKASRGINLRFYVYSMMVVIIVHLFLYDKPYLSLSGLESAIMKQALMRRNNPLKAAMASQSGIQLGLLMTLPMNMEIGPFSIEFQVSIVISFKSELSKLYPKFDLQTPRPWLASLTLPLRVFRTT